MIKKLFLFTGVVCITFMVQAQSNEFNAGLSMGLVASQIDGDTDGGFSKAGIAFGGFVNRYINEKWLWQFGLNYKQKGSKFINEEMGTYYHAKLNYMEMPFTIRYFHYGKIDFEGGICPGYLFDAKENLDGYEFKEPNPPFNKIELSSLFGINYSFSHKITLSIHYQYSMFPARYFLEGYEEYMDKNQYNNVTFFTLTYILPSRG